MSLLAPLQARCESKCELCTSSQDLRAYIVAPKVGKDISEQIAICVTCANQLEDLEAIDPNHWRCLNEAIWSQVPSVQVQSYRLLDQLKAEAWAEDLLGMIFMDDETLEWAQALGAGNEDAVVHKDSNGNVLVNGDTVVLIKDLNVKGGGFTAKRGTAVRRISLVMDNPEHIQGRINDQTIIILTKFVKK